MKRTKTQKGITLVALIITIIILLILAVVTIRTVSGDGIIQYAKNAASEYEKQQEREKQLLENYLAEIEGETSDSGSEGLVYVITDTTAKTVAVYGSRGNAEYTDTSAKVTTTGSIEIPSKVTIDGVEYTVTEIGENAFYSTQGGTDITSVRYPNSITKIGANAFKGCTNLVSIGNIGVLGETTLLESVGANAFANTQWLTTERYLATSNNGNGIVTLGYVVVDGKEATGDVTIHTQSWSIGDEAFKGNTNITSITLPDSIKSIGAGVFEGCTNLSSINISQNITTIRDRAFASCTSISSMELNSSYIQTMGSSVFKNWTSSQKIYVDWVEEEIPTGWEEDWLGSPCSASVEYEYWD